MGSRERSSGVRESLYGQSATSLYSSTSVAFAMHILDRDLAVGVRGVPDMGDGSFIHDISAA